MIKLQIVSHKLLNTYRICHSILLCTVELQPFYSEQTLTCVLSQMDFSLYPINMPLTLKILHGDSLICISLFPFEVSLTNLKRSVMTISCTELWNTF